MARYEREFSGIPGGFAKPRGMDPNFRDGYGGMRMHGGRGRAAYGTYRLWHEHDLETEGGFGGVRPTPEAIRARRYDPRWEDRGGIGDPLHDPRVIRDFNANSPDARGPAIGHRGEPRLPEVRRPAPMWSPRPDYYPGYSNRGVTAAGYSEAWARWPRGGGR